MSDKTTFTGRSRNQRTRLSVRLVDRAASLVITIGGIGTIAAISGIFVYLLWTVWPLFSPSGVEEPHTVRAFSAGNAPQYLRVADSDAIAWIIGNNGELTVLRPDTGTILSETILGEADRRPTEIATNLEGDRVTLGFEDGTVKIGSITFEPTFLDPLDPATEQFANLEPGERAIDSDGVVIRTPQGQLRRESVVVEFPGDPVEVSPGKAIEALDRVETTAGPVLLAWSADDRARIATIGRREDLFTGEIIVEPGLVAELPLKDAPIGDPLFVGLGPRAATATLLWPDGTTIRFDTRIPAEPRLIGRGSLATNQARITAAALMVGRLTLLIGDESGAVNAWFPVRKDKSAVEDAPESRMVLGHALGAADSPVTTIAPASRSRVAAIGYADGRLRLIQATTEQDLGETVLPVKPGETTSPAIFLPPGDETSLLYAATAEGLYNIPVDLGFPEVSLAAYFTPVRYESYAEQRHVWQTSASTNAAEPKLGMTPLVFGTLKATFYSMLFGVPLAMLAALYTSEFLSSKSRARIKPVIEVMASLPSVVLGFLAAIVFAPIVENWLAAIIAATMTVPLVVLFAARIWQAIPQSSHLHWMRWRLPLAALAIVGGSLLAVLLAGPLETLVFAGNLKLWLNGQIGSGFGAWMVLTLPLAVIGACWLSSRVINPRLLAISHRWSRRRFVIVDIARFLLITVLVFALSALLAWLFTLIGIDPRGEIVDTYVQRNALVVGFVMGFAIIPIIYTLADDALHAVPESLRSASLGAGATPWQTALRVVVPAAMSGLFSATMVGLGRAVGETMIVLMAAGNMPIMEINIFTGFQTLSAAIATEMPEAVRGSAHFRTLFFAALVLFGLTFLVNTIAEIVRLRFRRRVVQL